MREDTRTLQQNKALFLFHQMIVDEMNSKGITLDQLVVEVKPRPTKDGLHLIFKAILEQMYQKDTTTKMNKEEMKEVLEVYLEALANINVTIPFPEESKRTLLEFYS